MRGHKFQSQIFGTECRNCYKFLGLFLDSPDLIFRTVLGNFWDYFRTIQAEFSGLFSGNLELGSGFV